MEETGLHDRLRTVAGERTYRQIARLTGTHAESVRRYMQGQAPSVEFLTSLCAAMNINGSWLLTGQGPMLDHEVQPHALRTAETPDLLRALSDTVSVLIRRVDRLERLVQTTEIKLRAAGGGAGGSRAEHEPDAQHTGAVTGGTVGRAQAAADRIGSAAAKRASPDADRDDASGGA
jgi:transcriptional regulator with XRE-family HTH domain